MKQKNEIQTLAIIAPCFNESRGIIEFLRRIEDAVKHLGVTVAVIVVNDGSTDDTLDLLKGYNFQSHLIKLTILNLKFNVGHQNAIYQGLDYARGLDVDRFIIMDSDGQDDPRAIGDLLNYGEYALVQVARGKRMESVAFKLSYFFYKIIFKFVTGKRMDYGNYCMINRELLEKTLHSSFIHLAAFLQKQGVKKTHVVFDREKRIEGKSKMTFNSLVYYAFSSLTEYAEDMLMLFLKIFVVIMVFFIGSITYILYHKLVTHKALLGWSSVLSISLLNMALITIGIFIVGFLVLSNRYKRNDLFKQHSYEVINRSQYE